MNFSFSEILVILLIALLVIKPEQLPDLAFNVGRFVKSVRRLFSKIKTEATELIELADKTKEQKREQSSK